jgi:hypothetical protein
MDSHTRSKVGDQGLSPELYCVFQYRNLSFHLATLFWISAIAPTFFPTEAFRVNIALAKLTA